MGPKRNRQFDSVLEKKKQLLIKLMDLIDDDGTDGSLSEPKPKPKASRSKAISTTAKRPRASEVVSSGSDDSSDPSVSDDELQPRAVDTGYVQDNPCFLCWHKGHRAKDHLLPTKWPDKLVERPCVATR